MARSRGEPSAIAQLILDACSDRGWSLRELERMTNDYAERAGFTDGDKGLTISQLSNMTRNLSVEPTLRNLVILAGALDMPLRRLIAALGYHVESVEANTDRRQRALTMLESAIDTSLVEEVVNLPKEQQRAVQSFVRLLKEQEKG